MSENVASGLTGALALLGGLALVYRFMGGLFRLALRASEEAAARGLAEVRARHGDLTGMVERRRAADEAKRARRRSALLTLLWAVWLIVPLFAGGVRELYGLAAVLWLVPYRFRSRGSEEET